MANPSEQVQSLMSIQPLMGALNRRVTILEDRYDLIRKEHQFSEQNFIKGKQNFSKEIRAVDSNLKDLNENIGKLSEQIAILTEEIKDCAKKEDVDVIEKYLDLIEPLKFVTEEEAKKMTNEFLGKK